MTDQRIKIRQIQQIDNYHFQIDWVDGTVSRYRLSELQKHCPCAGCVDEATNERRISALSVSETVKAKRIQNVGPYALRILFTDGCSSGIYPFSFLKSFRRII